MTDAARARPEVIGPTFRRVILAVTCAAIGGGGAAATGAIGRGDTGPNPRLSVVEADVQTLKDRSTAIDRRLERIEDKLDRLIERK